MINILVNIDIKCLYILEYFRNIRFLKAKLLLIFIF